MGNQRMRFAGRDIAAMLAVALLAGCERDEGGRIDGDSLEVQIGVGGLSDPGRWCRALVTARTRAGVFEGEIIISGRLFTERASPERFRKRFEASTTPQTVEIPFLPRESWDLVDVAFRSRRAIDTFRVDPGWVAAPRQRILGIGGSPGFVRDLVNAPDEDDRLVRAAIGSIRATELPRTPLGLDVADLLVVFGDALFEADAEQIEALAAWVARGGTVAAVPAGAWTSRLPDGVGELFGLAAPLEPITAPDARALEASGRLGLTGDAIPGTLYRVEPRQGAGLSSRGLLLENPVGAGRAFLLTYSVAFAAPGARSGEQLEGAWSTIVRRSDPERSLARLVRSQSIEGDAVQSLQLLSGFNFPSRRDVAIFVVAYLLLGLPLAAVFIRRRKRLEFAYLFALILAIGASVAIYYFGFLSGVKEQHVDELGIGVLGGDGRTLEAISFLGVASPGRRIVDLVPDQQSEFLVSQPRGRRDEMEMFMGGSGDIDEGLLPLEYHVAGNVIGLPGFRLDANATRYLRVEHRVDLGGPFEARLVGDESTPRSVDVTNGTPHTLHVTYMENGLSREIGTLEPGARTVERTEPLSAINTRDRRLDLGFRYGGTMSDRQIIARFGGDLPARLFGAGDDKVSVATAPGVTLRTVVEAPAERREGRFLLVRLDAPIAHLDVLGPTRRSATWMLVELDQ